MRGGLFIQTKGVGRTRAVSCTRLCRVMAKGGSWQKGVETAEVTEEVQSPLEMLPGRVIWNS